MLSQQELDYLNADEKKFYLSAGSADKIRMEPALRAKARYRAEEKGIDLDSVLSLPASSHEMVSEAPPLSTATTRYGTARFVVGFMDFVGWVIVVIGGLWFLWSAVNAISALSELNSPYGPRSLSALGILSLLPSLGMAVGGLLVLAHGQLLRATLDTADDTREMLVLARASSTKSN